MSKKGDALQAKLDQIELNEGDLVEKFILGTGKGGQKINKTSSCVYLKHIPSGIEVKCQSERSRELNRQLAREELLKRLRQRERQRLLADQQEREKRKRQKRKRTRGGQEKVLEQKRRHSLKKRSGALLASNSLKTKI